MSSASAFFACVGAFFILDKELFPGEDFPQFFVQAEMPSSYGIQETSEVVKQIEAAAKTLPSTEVAALVSNIGIHTYNAGVVQGVSYGSNFGEVIVELTPKQERARGVDEIVGALRKETAIISGIEELNFVTLEGGPPARTRRGSKGKGPTVQSTQGTC